jgi:hypothetical protein
MEFRAKLINHILMMKTFDEDYAREALKNYQAAMPWLGLMRGVAEAMKLREEVCK